MDQCQTGLAADQCQGGQQHWGRERRRRRGLLQAGFQLSALPWCGWWDPLLCPHLQHWEWHCSAVLWGRAAQASCGSRNESRMQTKVFTAHPTAQIHSSFLCGRKIEKKKVPLTVGLSTSEYGGFRLKHGCKSARFSQP